MQCVSSLDPAKTYEVSYDTLVIGVGAAPNDFNVPGVMEHAFFLKVRRYGAIHVQINGNAVFRMHHYFIPKPVLE